MDSFQDEVSQSNQNCLAYPRNTNSHLLLFFLDLVISMSILLSYWRLKKYVLFIEMTLKKIIKKLLFYFIFFLFFFFYKKKIRV
jgi:hypothetical protein